MCWTQVGTKANEQSGGMAGTYGMRAVPLGPSCDLVVAGKAGMDGLWSAGIRSDTLAGKRVNPISDMNT